MRVAACAIGAAACLLGSVAPAWGHGREVVTVPKRDAVLRKSPALVTVTLSEAPTKDAVLKVTDGCNRELVGHLVVSGETVAVHLKRGQPGKYRARWRVISTVDGHPSDGSFSFTVKGVRDCSTDDEGNGNGTDEPDPDATAPGGGAAPPPAEDGGDDSGFPVVPVGLGALGVIGIALVARFAGSR
ncbi:MAG: copper resistance CopC family protein [Actinomycetota bacterium]